MNHQGWKSPDHHQPVNATGQSAQCHALSPVENHCSSWVAMATSLRGWAVKPRHFSKAGASFPTLGIAALSPTYARYAPTCAPE